MDRSLGTKRYFQAWLDRKHGITYTEYSKLPLEKKLEIQKEYKFKSKGVNNGATKG